MSRQQVCATFQSRAYKKLVTFFYFHFSTCVDEALLCKGIPLCKNRNDLKACKMHLPNMDIGYTPWQPIFSRFASNDDLKHPRYSCTPIGHPEYIMPFGQTIDDYNAHSDLEL